MPVSVTASMDCNYMVTVHVTNNTGAPFTGQSSTVSAWIVGVNLQPGESASYTAKFTGQKSVEGWVRGNSVEGYINEHWLAASAATCEAPPTTAPKPIDTTPKPVPTTTPGQTVIYCDVPGANPPMAWPCDDLAHAPVPTTTTTAPVAASEPPAAQPAPPEALEAPAPTQGRSGPPRTHTSVTVAKPVQTLPSTGNGDVLGILGSVVLVAGVILTALGRRRVA